MYDTIKFTVWIGKPDNNKMEKCGFRQRGFSWLREIYHNGCLIELRLPTLGDGYLHVTVSMPKFKYGHNVQMLTKPDLKTVPDYLNNILLDNGVDLVFDIWGSRITRLDSCCNFSTGSETNALAVRDIVSTCKLPQRITTITNDPTVPTVYMTPKVKRQSKPSVEFCAYLKFEETLKQVASGKVDKSVLNSAIGVIRFEERWHTAEAVKRKLANFDCADNKVLTAWEYMPLIAEKTMTDLVSKFGLDKEIEMTKKDNRIENLYNQYCKGEFDYATFERLAGYITLNDNYPASGDLKLDAKAKRVRRERKAKFKDLCISTVKPTRNYALPALIVPKWDSDCVGEGIDSLWD